MEIIGLLDFSEQSQLREWLKEHHASEKQCWVTCNRGKNSRPGTIPYIDVVEEALCFGWIDSTCKVMPDGRMAQRLSPRQKRSHWTELNKQRCADLERRGLMTEAGLEALKRADGNA